MPPDRTYVVGMGGDTTLNLRDFPDCKGEPSIAKASNTCYVAMPDELVEFAVIAFGNDFHTFHLHGHNWADNRTGILTGPADVRVGIATGYALLFEGDDYIGSAVNMASRLCDIAGPFEVLLPTMQLERLPEGITANPHGEVELRGFPGPIDVVELDGRPAQTVLNDTGELWTRTPFG